MNDKFHRHIQDIRFRETGKLLFGIPDAPGSGTGAGQGTLTGEGCGGGLSEGHYMNYGAGFATGHGLYDGSGIGSGNDYSWFRDIIKIEF